MFAVHVLQPSTRRVGPLGWAATRDSITTSAWEKHQCLRCTAMLTSRFAINAYSFITSQSISKCLLWSIFKLRKCTTVRCLLLLGAHSREVNSAPSSGGRGLHVMPTLNSYCIAIYVFISSLSYTGTCVLFLGNVTDQRVYSSSPAHHPVTVW